MSHRRGRRTALAVVLTVAMLATLAGGGALSYGSSAVSEASSTIRDVLVGSSGLRSDDGTPAQDQFCIAPGSHCGDDHARTHSRRRRHQQRQRRRHHEHHAHGRHSHGYRLRHQGPHRRDKRHR
jgi:hypothetical protein